MCKRKKLSLANYQMFVNDKEIDFYNNDKKFAAMFGYTVNKNNNGRWKEFYRNLLHIPIEVLTFAEHIIYQDLYRADDSLPKVVYCKDTKRYYIARDYWNYIHIELPLVFVEHFPQYKWLL